MMMKKLLCVVALMAAFITMQAQEVKQMESVVKDAYMTTDEVVRIVDSLAKTYYVDAKLNVDYLEKHPMKQSERKKLKEIIVYASPISSYHRPDDSLGVFRSLPVKTDEDRAKVRRLGDSISWSTVYTHCMMEEKEDLSDRYQLFYSLAFHRMNAGMELQRQKVVVIDRQTNDSIDVEMRDLKCCVLSNPPQVYALVFSVEFEGHVYVVHNLSDVRTLFNRKKDKLQKTKGCYVLDTE